MLHLSLITSLVVLCVTCYSYAQQCDQPSDVARFDCYPEGSPSQEKCEARKCCYKPAVQQSNSQNLTDPSAPYCYYPSDYPTYEVLTKETTDFGFRLRLARSQTTYLPKDILNLTADLIYETQQRFRIQIYDTYNPRYQVPLDVPPIGKKVDMTDYDVIVNSKPFSLLVTRKSTGAIL
jgi:lysosomal alpha-glucosidase